MKYIAWEFSWSDNGRIQVTKRTNHKFADQYDIVVDVNNTASA